MSMIKSVAVFCGSSPGNEPHFIAAAAALGKTLATERLRLIYGGAKVGLMGAVADAALGGGGQVIGIIPSFLKTKEIAHTGLTELITVETMHARKLKMDEYSDAIIALPGGYGTLEEMFEMLTWAQLGLHKKPIGLLNISGFYDGLIAMIEEMTARGFISQAHREMLLVADEIGVLLAKMRSYTAPPVPKWLTEETT